MVYTNSHGVVLKDKNKLVLFFIAISFAVMSAIGMLMPTSASHRGPEITHNTVECGETTVTAVYDGNVTNAYLVVHADGETQSANIANDGSGTTITVGPFYGDGGTEVISWNVFGGGERDFDNPHWNGYGDTDFASNINDYAEEQDGFSWVLDGPDEPNPFVNWNEFEVEGCEITKDMCKKGGYATFDFRNQGQCIRFVNTGQDSR